MDLPNNTFAVAKELLLTRSNDGAAPLLEVFKAYLKKKTKKTTVLFRQRFRMSVVENAESLLNHLLHNPKGALQPLMWEEV